jgi:YVTN family beta-propeller protein
MKSGELRCKHFICGIGLALLSFAFPIMSGAQVQDSGIDHFAYVTNHGSNSVSVIDLATNSVAATVPVGQNPVGVAVTPDGAFVYVANYGADSVSVLATMTNNVVATIPVSANPWGVAITPDGASVYVTNNTSNTVSVIATATNTVVATVPVGARPLGLAITPDGAFAYVANNHSHTISVIGTQTNTVEATIPVSLYPYAVAITPDGDQVHVTQSYGGYLNIIDTASNTVATVLNYSGLYANLGIDITPDGSLAYLAARYWTGAGTSYAVAYSVDSTDFTASILVGVTPIGLAISPDGAFVYVADYGSNSVVVVSTTTNTVVASIPVEANPYWVAFAPSTPRPTAGYWRFEEGTADVLASGTGSVLDETGNSNDGTPQGDAFYRDDVPEVAIPLTGAANALSLELDGTSYVSIPHSPSLDLADQFTVEFWMKGSTPPPGLYLVVDKSHGCTDSTGWVFEGDSTGQLRFAVGNGGGGVVNFAGAASVDSLIDGDWHHIAGTFDMTDTGQEVKLYVDGLLEATAASGTMATNTRDVNIGAWACGGGFSRFFAGSIDELRISSEVLTPEEFLIAASVPSDTEPPVLSLPSDLSVEATSADGAAVTFAATATDNVDGAVTPVCDPPSGSLFPLGTTEVECTATDAAGNTASGEFDVSVVDTTPPLVTVPASVTVEATGPDGAVVEFNASASDAVDRAVVAICVPAAGATYPVGSTTVTCKAADAAGNGADASFLVTVTETTPPILTVPDDLSVVATGSAGAVVEYNATAVDLVDGDVMPVCAPASGSTFAVGETTVSCTATDTAGNSTSASFTVTVEPAPWVGPSLSVLPEYDFAVATGTTATIEVELFNASSATHAATLAVVNPHTDLGVSLTSPPSITLDPGETGAVPLAIDAGSTPVGTYSQILLKLSIDDGSLLTTSITLYVTEAGAAELPDLALRAENLASAVGVPGDPVTLKATVANRGSLPATDVPVRFYEFGNLLGEVSLPAITADGTAVASLPVILSDGGDHLIEVVVDPDGLIAELDEANNAASFVVSLNTPPAQQGGIRVTGGLPTTVYTDALFNLSGRSLYELNVAGVANTDYVVKGGLVTITIREIGGGREWLYGGIHTDVTGDFTKSLIAPDDPGTYQVLVTVTDQTLISPALTLIVQVSEPPATPPAPPAAPVGLGGVGGGGSWSGEGVWTPPGGVLPTDYPPFDVQHDLSVFSEDIRFSKNNPAAGEEITLFAEIHYWAPRIDLVAEDVPVTFSVTKPGQSPIEVGATVIDSLSIGAPDYGARYVYATWEGADEGIYLVEVDIGSGSAPTTDEATLLNNAATRAIIVGELSASAEGAISGQVTNVWGGVGGVQMSILDQDDLLYGSVVSDATGFYLVSNLSVGERVVEIEAPLGYQPDAEAKPGEVVDRVVTRVDFFLTATPADINPPLLDLPADMVTEATGPTGAIVTYVVSATDAEDGEIAPSCVPASGSTFAPGTAAVACSATDSAGNTAEGSFSVTVQDTTPPVLTVPDDIVVEATGPSGAVVSYTATATDLVDGEIEPVCEPASESSFTLGLTTVACTATDTAKNSASGDFAITVVAMPCDIDENGVVDINDINAIAAVKNTPATAGDSRDIDGDGMINLNDARQCVLKCTHSRCRP